MEKRRLKNLFLVLFLLFSGVAYCADSTIDALPENLGPDSNDVFVIVDDPAGTPSTEQIKFSTIESALTITESQISDLVHTTAYTPDLFKAVGTSTSNPSAGPVDLTWDTPIVQDSSYALQADNFSVEINEDGWYDLTCQAGIDYNSRIELQAQLHINTGGGYTALTNEAAANYATRDANQNNGAVVLNTIYQFNDGDQLKCVASASKDGSGTPSLVPARTRLIIKELK